jgi:hypothetical protein
VKSALAFILLTLPLLLAGCNEGGASSPGTGLRAIETRNPDNSLASLTVLDRDSADNLVRVRHYTAPGSDGTWRSGDDELASYSLCTQTYTGDLLYDPLLELEGHAWTQERFTVRNCALDARASIISSQTFTDRGGDGHWFTADDIAQPLVLLERTATGHRRTVTGIAPAPCPVNCTGLTNIVYNPYAGIAPASTESTYVDGGLTGELRLPLSTLRYEFDGNHALLRKTLESPTQPGVHSVYERFDALPDGSRLVRQIKIVDSVLIYSMSGSPTGQILLAILGLSGPTVVIDGTPYSQVTSAHFRSIEQDGRPLELIQLVAAGSDGRWGTADDVTGLRQRYVYPDL